MAKSVYSMKVEFEIEVDTNEPHSVADAAKFMAELKAGKMIELPKGLNVTVTAGASRIRTPRKV